MRDTLSLSTHLKKAIYQIILAGPKSPRCANSLTKTPMWSSHTLSKKWLLKLWLQSLLLNPMCLAEQGFKTQVASFHFILVKNGTPRSWIIIIPLGSSIITELIKHQSTKILNTAHCLRKGFVSSFWSFTGATKCVAVAGAAMKVDIPSQKHTWIRSNHHFIYWVH